MARLEAEVVRKVREYNIIRAYPARCVAEILRAPLRDLRTREEWWVWLSITSDEDGPDYEADGPAADDDEQTWYDYSLDCVGLRDMINPGGGDIIKWMLENGIAPGQPFLMRFYGFWSSRDYRGEYDDGNDVDLVFVEPMSVKEAADRWHEWLRLGQDASYCAVVDAICGGT